MISYCSNKVNLSKPYLYYNNFKSINTNNIEIIKYVITKYAWSSCIFKNGERTENNFVCAYWIGLDFDDPITSLNQIQKLICDMTHIIGTTKSHQKDKKGIICDRFRLLLKLKKPITDKYSFRNTAKILIDHFESDASCVDAARFFWPCTEIVSSNSNGYLQEVYELSENELHNVRQENQKKFDADFSNKFSGYVLNILNHGFKNIDFSATDSTGKKLNSRNGICFRSALELARKNYSYEEIYTMIYRHIPPMVDFDEKERRRIVTYALRAKNKTR